MICLPPPFHGMQGDSICIFFTSCNPRPPPLPSTLLAPETPPPPRLPFPRSRKRALGGRYCLVCSLVARSSTTTNNDNSNNASPSGTPPVNRRLPLRHLVPGSGLPARQGPSACGLQKNASQGGGGLPSPVAITRLRRGSSRPGQLKDGVFFRPLPKARRGSWGGEARGFVVKWLVVACSAGWRTGRLGPEPNPNPNPNFSNKVTCLGSWSKLVRCSWCFVLLLDVARVPC